MVGSAPPSKFVSLVLDVDANVFDSTDCADNTDEAYQIVTEDQSVVITAVTDAGIFYGIQVIYPYY